MYIKRLMALASCALLAQLTLVSGDFTCATHGSSLMVVAAVESAPDHGSESSHPQASTEEENCDVPLGSDCCLAHASCSLNLRLDSGADELDPAVPMQEVRRPLTERLASATRSPDPPPPKLA